MANFKISSLWSVLAAQLGIALGLSGLLMTFQNCGEPFAVVKFEGSSLASEGTAAELSRFAKAKAVLDSKCVTCHQVGGQAASSPFNFVDPNQFVSAGLVTPGSLSGSKLIYRLRNYSVDNGVRNMPPTGELTSQEYSDVSEWVLLMGQSSVNAFTCSSDEAPAELNAKRLSRLEYFNAVRSLVSRALGEVDATALMTQANLPNRLPEDSNGSYTTSDANFSVAHASEYFNAADVISTNLISNANYPRFVNTYIGYSPGTCVIASVDTLSVECQNTLIRNFLLRAWGRQVDSTITNANNELAAFQREFQLASSSRAGVEAMIMKALISPQFLFHLQIDLRAPQGDVYPLTSHAIARRLSFLFSQTLPDEALVQMASQQDLATDQGFTAAVSYLSSRMDPTVQQFTREWLRLDRLPTFVDQTHPKFVMVSQGLTVNEGLRTAMRNEVTDFMTYLNRSNRGVSEILTSNISFARDPSLMRIYGQTTPAPANVTEANAVRFPAAERSGLLTRAAMLMSGGHTENPILRGVHIRKYVMCLSTPQPGELPPDALAPPLPDARLTTRERYHNKTTTAACISCHSQINPVGFALSKYNAFGAFQANEPIFNAMNQFVGTLPTNSTVDLTMGLNISRQVPDGIEMSEAIAGSPQFRSCLTKNFHTYASGLSEIPVSTNSCAMNRMYQTLNSGATLNEFFRSSVSDSRFRFRKLSR